MIILYVLKSIKHQWFRRSYMYVSSVLTYIHLSWHIQLALLVILQNESSSLRNHLHVHVSENVRHTCTVQSA